MANTLILYDGKLSSTERVANNLGMIIGNVRIAEISEAPKDISPYDGFCFIFNFYGALTAGKTRQYLTANREAMVGRRIALVGMGFSDNGFTKYVVDMEDAVGEGLSITGMFISDEHQVFESGFQIARKFRTPWNQMDPDELTVKIDEFIKAHTTLALATASTGNVRCTPLEYNYQNGVFYIVTEGGLKFRSLLSNDDISAAIFDSYDGSMNHISGLQFSGKATIVEHGSDEYWQVLSQKHVTKEACEKLPVELFIVRIVPLRYEFLCSKFNEEGYDAKQAVDTRFAKQRWEDGAAFAKETVDYEAVARREMAEKAAAAAKAIEENERSISFTSITKVKKPYDSKDIEELLREAEASDDEVFKADTDTEIEAVETSGPEFFEDETESGDVQDDTSAEEESAYEDDLGDYDEDDLGDDTDDEFGRNYDDTEELDGLDSDYDLDDDEYEQEEVREITKASGEIDIEELRRLMEEDVVKDTSRGYTFTDEEDEYEDDEYEDDEYEDDEYEDDEYEDDEPGDEDDELDDDEYEDDEYEKPKREKKRGFSLKNFLAGAFRRKDKVEEDEYEDDEFEDDEFEEDEYEDDEFEDDEFEEDEYEDDELEDDEYEDEEYEDDELEDAEFEDDEFEEDEYEGDEFEEDEYEDDEFEDAEYEDEEYEDDELEDAEYEDEEYEDEELSDAGGADAVRPAEDIAVETVEETAEIAEADEEDVYEEEPSIIDEEEIAAVDEEEILESDLEEPAAEAAEEAGEAVSVEETQVAEADEEDVYEETEADEEDTYEETVLADDMEPESEETVAEDADDEEDQPEAVLAYNVQDAIEKIRRNMAGVKAEQSETFETPEELLAEADAAQKTVAAELTLDEDEIEEKYGNGPDIEGDFDTFDEDNTYDLFESEAESDDTPATETKADWEDAEKRVSTFRQIFSYRNEADEEEDEISGKQGESFDGSDDEYDSIFGFRNTSIYEDDDTDFDRDRSYGRTRFDDDDDFEYDDEYSYDDEYDEDVLTDDELDELADDGDVSDEDDKKKGGLFSRNPFAGLAGLFGGKKKSRVEDDVDAGYEEDEYEDDESEDDEYEDAEYEDGEYEDDEYEDDEYEDDSEYEDDELEDDSEYEDDELEDDSEYEDDELEDDSEYEDDEPEDTGDEDDTSVDEAAADELPDFDADVRSLNTVPDMIESEAASISDAGKTVKDAANPADDAEYEDADLADDAEYEDDELEDESEYEDDDFEDEEYEDEEERDVRVKRKPEKRGGFLSGLGKGLSSLLGNVKKKDSDEDDDFDDEEYEDDDDYEDDYDDGLFGDDDLFDEYDEEYEDEENITRGNVIDRLERNFENSVGRREDKFVMPILDDTEDEPEEIPVPEDDETLPKADFDIPEISYTDPDLALDHAAAVKPSQAEADFADDEANGSGYEDDELSDAGYEDAGYEDDEYEDDEYEDDEYEDDEDDDGSDVYDELEEDDRFSSPGIRKRASAKNEKSGGFLSRIRAAFGGIGKSEDRAGSDYEDDEYEDDEYEDEEYEDDEYEDEEYEDDEYEDAEYEGEEYEDDEYEDDEYEDDEYEDDEIEDELEDDIPKAKIPLKKPFGKIFMRKKPDAKVRGWDSEPVGKWNDEEEGVFDLDRDIDSVDISNLSDRLVAALDDDVEDVDPDFDK